MGSDKFAEWLRPILESKHGMTRTDLMQSAWAGIGDSGYKYRIEVLKARKVIAAVGLGRFNRWTTPENVEAERQRDIARMRPDRIRTREAINARKRRERKDAKCAFSETPVRVIVPASVCQAIKAGPASIWEAAAWIR